MSSPKILSQESTWSICLLSLAIFLNACGTSEPGRRIQKKIAGKTIVIVGASSGFGRGVAEQLGRYKANVVLAARRTDALEEIASTIRSGGGSAEVVTTDISKPEDVQRLSQIAVERFGKIDVWINMAGVGAIGRFWEIPLEEQSRLIDINLKGFIYGSHVAITQFKKQGYGRLINMGSVESVTPLAYHASYAASKGGILNLSQTLNQELRLSGDKKKIHVVTIEPWAADTPFWRHAANYSGGTPRMAAMDRADKIVNATIRACLKNRHELPVGWKAKGSWLSHHIFPRMTEKFAANVAHKYQIKDAPPAEPTSGALYQPVTTGKGIEDGVRQRMKKEKRMMRKVDKDDNAAAASNQQDR